MDEIHPEIRCLRYTAEKIKKLDDKEINKRVKELFVDIEQLVDDGLFDSSLNGYRFNKLFKDITVYKDGKIVVNFNIPMKGCGRDLIYIGSGVAPLLFLSVNST